MLPKGPLPVEVQLSDLGLCHRQGTQDSRSPYTRAIQSMVCSIPCWPPGAVDGCSECAGQEGSVWVDTEAQTYHFLGRPLAPLQRKHILTWKCAKDGKENRGDHACALSGLPFQGQSGTPDGRNSSLFKGSWRRWQNKVTVIKKKSCYLWQQPGILRNSQLAKEPKLSPSSEETTASYYCPQMELWEKRGWKEGWKIK